MEIKILKKWDINATARMLHNDCFYEQTELENFAFLLSKKPSASPECDMIKQEDSFFPLKQRGWGTSCSLGEVHMLF